MPLSAVWAGPERNEHLDGPPLLITRTEGATPFRLTTHVGDVGHALVVGPTGAGKSVLLATLILQFRKYVGNRIYVFDKGRSVRAAMLGLGGQFHDLGLEGGLTFQPLRTVDDPSARAWAAEWVQALLGHERIEVTPEVKDAVWSALGSLGSAPVEERTLSGLATLLQSNKLRQALQPYTLDGPFGRLLDADHEDLQPRRSPGVRDGGPAPRAQRGPAGAHLPVSTGWRRSSTAARRCSSSTRPGCSSTTRCSRRASANG